MSIRLHPSVVMHPGVWLRSEIVEPHGLSVADAAAKLHVTRQAMDDLLSGRPALSSEMAIRLEETYGLSADTLMRMQTAYDPWSGLASYHGDDTLRRMQGDA